jgi:cbb3-type cytochrome c oxidase subunit III
VRARLGASVLALAVGLLSAGCGTGTFSEGSGNTAEGQQLFQQKCGSCHTLRAAGTKGQIGPNLDDAFRASRSEGLGESSIREVVLGQIKYPGKPTDSTKFQAMPANLVTGDDAAAVAAFVASVAGNPNARPVAAAGGGGGAQAAGNDPKSLMSSNCGSCHTFAAAGITGTVGPNLDQSTKDLAAIIKQITNGGAVMPPFKGKLTDQQIKAIAQFILKNRGK